MGKKKKEKGIGSARSTNKLVSLSLSLCLMETNVFLPCLALMVICDCHRYFDVAATFLFVCWRKKKKYDEEEEIIDSLEVVIIFRSTRPTRFHHYS